MKHLLNDLSSEEKNRIREQYEGGMKIDTNNDCWNCNIAKSFDCDRYNFINYNYCYYNK